MNTEFIKKRMMAFAGGELPLDRTSRSPTSEAVTVLFSMDTWYHEFENKKIGDYINCIFSPIHKSKDTPDSRLLELLECDVDDSYFDPVLNIITRVAVYCSAAMKSDEAGDLNLAWTYAADAVAFFGEIKGGHGQNKAWFDALSNRASRAAKKKNEQPREWVLSEWSNRPDQNQRKAAFARQYSPLVKKRFGVIVNPDTIARDWLPKAEKKHPE